MKNIKILFSIGLLCCMISCSKDNEKNPLGPTTEHYEFKWLSTSGSQIVDSDGKQVILHGVNRSGLEYDKKGNGMSQAEFDYICQNWQAKIIRIPFNQEWIMTDDAYNNFLDRVIGWIKNNGAYVILDLQWQNTTIKIPRIPDTSAVTMWKKLALRYKDDPAIVYDIHNEAHDVGLDEWRDGASQIITGIRSVHPKALILVSGLNWANDISGWAQHPLPYDHIVYSLHVYPWFSNATQFDKLVGNYCDRIPIFVGEFGGYVENTTWGRQLMAYLNEKGLGWTAWSWVDDPHLTQQNNRRTPTEFGAAVREMLIRHASPDQYLNRLSQLTVDFISANRATINWKTTQRSDSKVLFGTTTSYDQSVYSAVFLNSHTMKLTDLQPNTMYHFKVISVDEFGFKAESSDSTFTTTP